MLADANLESIIEYMAMNLSLVIAISAVALCEALVAKKPRLKFGSWIIIASLVPYWYFFGARHASAVEYMGSSWHLEALVFLTVVTTYSVINFCIVCARYKRGKKNNVETLVSEGDA